MSSSHENTPGPGLVNEDRLFSRQLPRLFAGTVTEVLRELLQNSDRAGAQHVALDIPEPGRLTYQDDGGGIQGLEGLFHLLCVANSSWEDPTVEPNQEPMGLGFFSLLVQPQVQHVSVQSNAVALDIDTQRFLQDAGYRNGWVQRVEKHPAHEHPGFRLDIRAAEAFTDAVKAALLGAALTPSDYWHTSKHFSPARGYQGRLAITLDGVAVETGLPDWFTLPGAEIVDRYQGNATRIALSTSDVHLADPPEFARDLTSLYDQQDDYDRGGLRLCWFGQPISERTGFTQVRVFLEVRAGAPLTPRAPTRESLVQDGKLTALRTWVVDRVFRYVCEELAAPSPQQVSLLYELDRDRAERECPWALVRLRRGLPEQPAPSEALTVTCCDDVGALTLGQERVVRKAALATLPLMLGDGVQVLLPGTHNAFRDWRGKLSADATDDPKPCTFPYGLESFLAALDLQGYQPQLGATATAFLWWRPGELAQQYYTTDPGEWGIGTQDTPPQEWKPMPTGKTLYVFDETQAWDIDDVVFIVAAPDLDALITWLKHSARVCWYLDDEGDDCEERFDETVDSLIRDLLGDTIDSEVIERLLYEVAPFCGGRAHIEGIDLTRTDSGEITSVRVRTKAGEVKTLRLY